MAAATGKLSITHERMNRLTEVVDRYAQGTKSVDWGQDIELGMLRIMMHRHAGRVQGRTLSLFDDPEPAVPVKAKAQIADGARVHLHHEYDRPLQFGLDDPALAAAAVTLETSIWEAALCPVQRTDFRNFAHGRHVWMTHRGEQTQVISLTTMFTELVWGEIRGVLPLTHAALELDYRTGGRFEAALAIVDALLIVEAIGNATMIDPGKPGTGPYAKDIYEGRALQSLSARLPPSVRHKMAARRLRDENPVDASSPLVNGALERMLSMLDWAAALNPGPAPSLGRFLVGNNVMNSTGSDVRFWEAALIAAMT